jgi:hypothetical protein
LRRAEAGERRGLGAEARPALAAVAAPLEQETLWTTGNSRVLVPVGNVELLQRALHPQLVLRHDPLPDTTFLQLILWGLQHKKHNIVTYDLSQAAYLTGSRSNSN